MAPNELGARRRRSAATRIATDIDCTICMNTVLQALRERPDVDRVIEHAATGELVVWHSTDPNLLRDLVVRLGHAVVEAGNGEVVMGSVTAHTDSCHDPHCVGSSS